jgi:hypothetical protein
MKVSRSWFEQQPMFNASDKLSAAGQAAKVEQSGIRVSLQKPVDQRIDTCFLAPPYKWVASCIEIVEWISPKPQA